MRQAPVGIKFSAGAERDFHFFDRIVRHGDTIDRGEKRREKGFPGCKKIPVIRLLNQDMVDNRSQCLFLRVSRRLLQELGREPSDEEIGEEMGITPEKVREIVKVSQDPVSLETPIGEEEDSHLGDFVEDREAVSPQDAASLTMLHSEVEDVLDTLTPRERRVLQLRFGLIDGHQRTLEEVGKRFGVTRERIRQIEAKALRKLRHPSRSKKLRDYLE